MPGIRRTMSRELGAALQACAQMGPTAAAEAAQLVAKLGQIRRRIEDRAAALGYSERCRQSIPVCAGECCVWHFPRNIDRVDFLVAITGLSAAERAALVKQVQATDDSSCRCPLLREDGCILTFDNRPVVCTNAFPCIAGSEYWQYKETFQEDIEDIRAELNRLIDSILSG